jgi:transcriptional regulator with XRE-family HTH domain
MDAATFWGNVKPLIKANNITQRTLASVCGIPFGTLQGQIVKNILPDVVSAYLIAQSLHTSIEYLLTGQEPEASHKYIDRLEAIKAIVNQPL